MGERRYWSVRDARWLPSPPPVDALGTPWSLHARQAAGWEPCPTPQADLRWLRAVRPAGVPAQRSAGRPETEPATGESAGDRR